MKPYINILKISNSFPKLILQQVIIQSVLGLILINPVDLCHAQYKKFSYSQVYEGKISKIIGQNPDIEGWYDEEYYLTWKSNAVNEKTKLIKIRAETGESEILFDFTQIDKEFMNGRLYIPWEAHTEDYKSFIFRHNEDLFYLSGDDKLIRQLTASKSKEINPIFSPDGNHIAFTRDHDLYTINIETGEEERLTSDGGELVYNGYASWVYYEEILGRSSKYKAFWWAPDSKKIAFLRFDDTIVPEYPIFHGEGLHEYVEVQRYPKAGEIGPSVKLGVYHLENKETVWIDIDDRPDHYIAWPSWAPDSKILLFQSLNRGQDTIRIYKSDPYSGLKTMIYEESQSSWVEFFEDLYLFKDKRGFLLRSDKSGWRHLYIYDLDGHLIRRLTEGEWDVNKIVSVDEKNNIVYFQGFQKKSTETHLFRVHLNTLRVKKITQGNGTHSANVSPGGKYFIDTYSNISHPENMDLYGTDGNFIRKIGERNLTALNSYALATVEIFKIRTEDDVELPALWVLPPNFDSSKKYPVIFQVYGGPGRASVKNKYPALSHHYLAQNNIITIMVDHRGSYHFGKKGQSLMYRNLGKWEMNDYIEAVKWLKELPFIDNDLIGIEGSSYGGYVVAMALTYGADYFTHGVALYSVTDWQLYDNVYTERYMDRPAENPDGYKFGSALTHVEKYKGNMLIIHGALDDNVHMQNITQFIQLLQKHEKNFEIMIYPNQKHGTTGAWRKHSSRETVNFWFRHFLDRELTVE